MQNLWSNSDNDNLWQRSKKVEWKQKNDGADKLCNCTISSNPVVETLGRTISNVKVFEVAYDVVVSQKEELTLSTGVVSDGVDQSAWETTVLRAQVNDVDFIGEENVEDDLQVKILPVSSASVKSNCY